MREQLDKKSVTILNDKAEAICLICQTLLLRKDNPCF